jgi:trigger factor
VAQGQFIPGFTEQLIGLKAGEKRTVNITFPADFVSQPLAGKPAVYEVELVEVKRKLLPALDDAFAKNYGAEDMAKLREGVRKDLQNELDYKKHNMVREQVVKELLARITCDLPESVVNQETKHVVYDLVSENQKRGISKEVFEKEKDQIYSFASASARERVKANFAFHRIAEKENLKVTQEELLRRIYALAAQYNMAPDKFAKELQKRDGVQEVAQQVLTDKVINFLADHAKIEDVPPAAPAQ